MPPLAGRRGRGDHAAPSQEALHEFHIGRHGSQRESRRGPGARWRTHQDGGAPYGHLGTGQEHSFGAVTLVRMTSRDIGLRKDWDRATKVLREAMTDSRVRSDLPRKLRKELHRRVPGLRPPVKLRTTLPTYDLPAGPIVRSEIRAAVILDPHQSRHVQVALLTLPLPWCPLFEPCL